MNTTALFALVWRRLSSLRAGGRLESLPYTGVQAA